MMWDDVDLSVFLLITKCMAKISCDMIVAEKKLETLWVSDRAA